MHNETVASRTSGFSALGVFLILAGGGLLLRGFGLLPFSWGEVVWTALGAFGLSLVINAAIQHRRGGVFIGSLLFFFSALVLLRRTVWCGATPFDWSANIMLVIGASFLVLYLFDPKRFGILAAVVFFGGIGTLYYLWWMDVLDAFTVRHYVRTYWPVLLILLGLGVVLKRR